MFVLITDEVQAVSHLAGGRVNLGKVRPAPADPNVLGVEDVGLTGLKGVGTDP
jgi:hypothetical protein